MTVVVELDDDRAELILMPTAPVLRVEDLTAEERATVDAVSALVAQAEQTTVSPPARG